MKKIDANQADIYTVITGSHINRFPNAKLTTVLYSRSV